MSYNYSYQKFNKEVMARSNGTNLPVSLKKSIETLSAIRGKKVDVAIKFLENVIDEKAVVPYKRYNTEMPHKRGVGISSGGYPVNVAKAILILIKNAKKNAVEQEISGILYVESASARKGTRRFHMGRHMGTSIKSTSIEIIVGARVNKEVKKND